MKLPAPTTMLILPALCVLALACGDTNNSGGPGAEDAGTADATPEATADDTNDAAVADDASNESEAPDAGDELDAAPAAETAKAFSLRFAAKSGEKRVGCGDTLRGLGASGDNTAQINDLRFYVSNLRFVDTDGEPVEHTLDEDEFQLRADAGTVSLVDLTSNELGACNPDVFPDSEGTKRTHEAITGTTLLSKVAGVQFDVGVPQALMKAVIADNTAEGAPSPLAEMHWSWSMGYRHFVWNFALENAAGERGAGFVHVGSTDCGPMDGNALSDRDACGFINTPSVALAQFSIEDDLIEVDLDAILRKLDFVAPLYNDAFEVIGQGPGVQCHSFPSAADCSDVFDAFGLSLATGAANAAKNVVFAVGDAE